MPSVSSLKDRARKEEKRGNWSRAVDLYRQALERAERDGDLMRELGLYNRIGDLHLRLEDTGQAVESFLEAAERYSEEDLQAPAVAMCNKILRLAPDRDEVRLRLVHLHLRSGLVADARQALLEYVRRADASGREDEALEAILEFLDSEDDERLRVDVAGRLVDAGRAEEAADHLLKVRDARAARDEPVVDVEERIRSLVPGIVGEEELGGEPGATPAPAADEAGPEVESEAEAEPEVEAEVEPEAQAEAETEVEPEAQPEAEAAGGTGETVPGPAPVDGQEPELDAEPTATERKRRSPRPRRARRGRAGSEPDEAPEPAPEEPAATASEAGPVEQEAEPVAEPGESPAPQEVPSVPRHRRALPASLPPLSSAVPVEGRAVASDAARGLPAEAWATVPGAGEPGLPRVSLDGTVREPEIDGEVLASELCLPATPAPVGARNAGPTAARPLSAPVAGGPEASAPAGPMALVRFRLAGTGLGTLAPATALPEIPSVALVAPVDAAAVGDGAPGPARGAAGRATTAYGEAADVRAVVAGLTAAAPASPVPIAITERPEPSSGAAAGVLTRSASIPAPGPTRIDGRPIDPGPAESAPAAVSAASSRPAGPEASAPADALDAAASWPVALLHVGRRPVAPGPANPDGEGAAAGEKASGGGVMRSLRRIGLFGGGREEDAGEESRRPRRSAENGSDGSPGRTGTIPGLAPPAPGDWVRPVPVAAMETVPPGPSTAVGAEVADAIPSPAMRLAAPADLTPVRAPWEPPEAPEAPADAGAAPEPRPEPPEVAGEAPSRSETQESAAEVREEDRGEPADVAPLAGAPPETGVRTGKPGSPDPDVADAEPEAEEAQAGATEVGAEAREVGKEAGTAEVEAEAAADIPEVPPEASGGEPEPARPEPEAAEAERETTGSEREATGEEPAGSAADEEAEPGAEEEPGAEVDEEPEPDRSTEESLTTLLRRRWADLEPPAGPDARPPAARPSEEEAEPEPAVEPAAEAEREPSAAVEAGPEEPGAKEPEGGAGATPLEDLLAPELDRDEDFPNLTSMLERMGWLGGGEASPAEGDEAAGEEFVHPAPWKEGARRKEAGTSRVEPAGVEGAVTDDDVPDLTGMLRSMGWLGGDEEVEEGEREPPEEERD